jgi:hypothetical protein
MKSILIDPFEKTVTEVEHTGDYRHIYDLIKCDTFTCVQISRTDAVYVDDNGLLGNLEEQQFFSLLPLWHEPLAGRGLILGVDSKGDSTAPKITVEEVLKHVAWYSLDGLRIKFLLG